jgi:hypothetical protein
MVSQVAAGFIGTGFVSLISLPGGSSKPDRIVQLDDNSGANPGGALRFFGLPEMVASTNNGDGITYLNTFGWPVAKAMGVARDANLKPSLNPTIGFTAFPPY